MACENYIKLKFQCSSIRFYCHIATLICLYIIFGCLCPTRLSCLLPGLFKKKHADSCFKLWCIYYRSFCFLSLLHWDLLLVFRSAFHNCNKISQRDNVRGRMCFGLCLQIVVTETPCFGPGWHRVAGTMWPRRLVQLMAARKQRETQEWPGSK